MFNLNTEDEKKFISGFLKEAFNKNTKLVQKPDQHILCIGEHYEIILKSGIYRILEDSKEIFKFSGKEGEEKVDVMERGIYYKNFLEMLS